MINIDKENILLHEKDILTLNIEKRALQKKIEKIDREIENIRGYNREMKGRQTMSDKPLED